MAYSAGDITAAEQAGVAADAPLMIGTNAIESVSSDGSFVAEWNATTADYGTDATAAADPARRGYDRQSHIKTTANASGTTWWYVLDAGTTTFPAFDCAYIAGHNFGANSATCSLQISNTSNLTTGGVEIATWTPSAPTGNIEAPLVSLDLDDGANAQPQVFTVVDYLGIKITAGAGFIPSFGELWLGKRRQLHKPPRMGYNPNASASDTSDFVSLSGVTTRYTRNRSGYVLSADYISDTAARATVITSLYSDIEEGTLPLVWVERPSSAPNTARVMLLKSPALPGGSHMSSRVRSWKFNLVEVAPFLSRTG